MRSLIVLFVALLGSAAMADDCKFYHQGQQVDQFVTFGAIVKFFNYTDSTGIEHKYITGVSLESQNTLGISVGDNKIHFQAPGDTYTRAKNIASTSMALDKGPTSATLSVGDSAMKDDLTIVCKKQ